MKLHVGEVYADVTPVSNIPSTSSGKFRAVICELNSNDKKII